MRGFTVQDLVAPKKGNDDYFASTEGVSSMATKNRSDCDDYYAADTAAGYTYTVSNGGSDRPASFSKSNMSTILAPETEPDAGLLDGAPAVLNMVSRNDHGKSLSMDVKEEDYNFAEPESLTESQRRQIIAAVSLRQEEAAQKLLNSNKGNSKSNSNKSSNMSKSNDNACKSNDNAAVSGIDIENHVNRNGDNFLNSERDTMPQFDKSFVLSNIVIHNVSVAPSAHVSEASGDSLRNSFDQPCDIDPLMPMDSSLDHSLSDRSRGGPSLSSLSFPSRPLSRVSNPDIYRPVEISLSEEDSERRVLSTVLFDIPTTIHSITPNSLLPSVANGEYRGGMFTSPVASSADESPLVSEAITD